MIHLRKRISPYPSGDFVTTPRVDSHIRGKNMLRIMISFIRNPNGVALTEMGMLLALVAVVSLLAVSSTGIEVNRLFRSLGNDVGSVRSQALVAVEEGDLGPGGAPAQNGDETANNPEPFVFGDVVDAQPGSVVTTQESATIAGLSSADTLVLTGAIDAKLIVNGFDAGTASLVDNGDLVQVRMAASTEYGTVKLATLQLNDFMTTWSVTTVSDLTVDYLVVAGGGGGGAYIGGGGGGGGVLSGTVALARGSYDAVVGHGGAGGIFAVSLSQSGENSSFAGNTAIGGGRGGHWYPSEVLFAPEAGGSGGGGIGCVSCSARSGAEGSSGQGNSGGDGSNPSNNSGAAGGGGGAGAPGGDSVASVRAGHGGDGIASAVTGVNSYYGGGGGGGAEIGVAAGAGGAGGGGSGTNSDAAADNGAANTGGGGGGAGHVGLAKGAGGNGGSGVVMVRYAGAPVATGGEITQIDGFTIHTFTSSGAFAW